MARRATNSRPTGARRSPSPSGWAGLPNTAPSCRASSKTITSTARSSGWMVRCAFRRNNRPGSHPPQHYLKWATPELPTIPRRARAGVARRSVLAGRQLGDNRAEVLGLERLVLRGQRVVDGGQHRALEVHVEDAFGAFDGLLR